MNRTVLLLAGGAALVYWWFTNHVAVAFPGPVTTGTPPPVGNPSATPPQANNFNSLANIYARMVADAQVGASGTATPFQWNYSLGRVWSGSPPDPTPLFADPSIPITGAQYWSTVSPWLHTNAGLSGLGGLSGWLA